MTAAKPSSNDAVKQALTSDAELTSAEIATKMGLGRSTVTKALSALERAADVRRSPGGREGGRRLPDRWSLATGDQSRPRARASTGRLRPGELDNLVLGFINAHARDAAVGPTAVAKALGRSAGAVGNCLTRLAATDRVRQVGERPRRYRSTAPRASAPNTTGREKES